MTDYHTDGLLSVMRVCGSKNAHPRVLGQDHERGTTIGMSNASDLVLPTVNLAVMTAVDLLRHWMTTTRTAKTASTTDPRAMRAVTRTMMTGTATRRAAGVIVRELHQQTPSIAAAVATRTSTVHRDHTATEAKNIAVATAPDHLARKTNTKTTRRMPMAKRIPMAAHGVNIGVGATDHATRSVTEIVKTGKSENATMTTTVRRIVRVTKTRTVGGAAIVRLKMTTAITMTTSTALHVVAARTESASDATTMTVSAKTSHPNQRRRRMLLVR
jgi:hypothetical protein